MKEEKVMCIQLPEGANYRRVEVTDDGIVSIFYTKKCVNENETIKNICVSIPKPIPLIGGTEVYQKDNGLPYWYCRIKEGRDEFMHLYFGDLTEEDLLYEANGKERKFETDGQKEFKANALKALKNKPQEGYRWIPVFEPSIDFPKFEPSTLRYVEGEKVTTEINSYEWEEIFKEYSPDNGSQMASITTYFLLTLRWLKDGVATLKQLADDLNEIGHAISRYIKYNLEYETEFKKTGECEFGGLYGFAGNTYKAVKNPESPSGFSRIGGFENEYAFNYPLTMVSNYDVPEFPLFDGVGLLELTK